VSDITVINGYMGRYSNTFSATVSAGAATVSVIFPYDVIINELSCALDVDDTGSLVKFYRQGVAPGLNCGQSQVAYNDTDQTWRLFMAGETLIAKWSGITTAATATVGVIGLQFVPGYAVEHWLRLGATVSGR